MKQKGLLVVVGLFLAFSLPAVAGEDSGTAVHDLAAVTVLDLETAQRIALAANPTMDAALARVEQARARLQQASAAWWPSVDVTGSGGTTRQSDAGWKRSQAIAGLYGGTVDRTSEDYAGGIQASWVLFDGFYRSLNEKKAELGEESAVAGRADARRLLAAAVAEAFYNAQLAATNVQIAQADSEFYSQQLRDAENRYEVGAGPWGDVLNIKVQMNSAKTIQLLSSREQEAAGYGLAALLGVPDARFPANVSLPELGRDIEVGGSAIDVDRLIEDAIRQRPDIRRAELATRQAEAGIGMAGARYYPKLQLTGSVNGARQGDVSLTGEDFGNTLFLNLSWNIFAGGADKARKFEATQAKREADDNLLASRNQAAAEVRQAVALLEAAREQVILQRESVSLVEENRELAKSQYEAGEASLVRLNEAQRDLTATYGRLAQAQVAYLRAEQRLDAATGRNIALFSESEAQP